MSLTGYQKLLKLFLKFDWLNHRLMGHELQGYGYWPMTHVTHPDLLTHLTNDPLTHCQLWLLLVNRVRVTTNLSWLFFVWENFENQSATGEVMDNKIEVYFVTHGDLHTRVSVQYTLNIKPVITYHVCTRQNNVLTEKHEIHPLQHF